MDPLSIGLGIGGSLIGSALQRRENERAAERNYQYGEKSAKNAYERQLQAWKMQNEYNTPLAQTQRLKDAGLSVGLMYSGGAGGASNAGSLSSVSQGGSSGSYQPVKGEGYLANMINAMSLAKMKSEVAVNESVANRNNSEANVVNPTRADLNTSQQMLNMALGDNARARTTGQELNNALQLDLNPLTIEQAQQQLSKNEALLRQYAVDLEKTVVETQFSKDTYNTRTRAVEVDLQNKIIALAVQQAQIESLRSGARLSTAQSDELEAYLRQYLSTGWNPQGNWMNNLGSFIVKWIPELADVVKTWVTGNTGSASGRFGSGYIPRIHR